MKGVFLAIGPEGFGTYSVEGDRYEPVQGQPEGVLSPGLVDIHIHGAFGIDFMSATNAEMVDLASKLEEDGYETWLPTTVTATPEAISNALASIPQHRSIWGFHLEGPFISPEFAGAQPPSLIVTPCSSDPAWQEIVDDSRLQVITMAPEVPGVLDLAKNLNARGVVVSMGHTNATFAQSQLGWDAGFRHATHIFNAMRPFHHREAGAVGFALAQEELNAELIYDRLHVSPDAVKVLIRAKGKDHVIAVSDSTMASGLPSGTKLKMWGHDCLVASGSVRIESSGSLAGSAITLRTAFQNLMQDFGAEIAIRACCHNPRRAIGLQSEPKVRLVWSLDGELRERIEL
ncbi:MAG: amidohydrolase family protein [Chthonomonas sp.]|nr:amidohydrolase family protein [Chthonomonas sp.]